VIQWITYFKIVLSFFAINANVWGIFPRIAKAKVNQFANIAKCLGILLQFAQLYFAASVVDKGIRI
jgi:hypothetical protein